MSEIGIDKDEISAWIHALGSMPISRIAHEDRSQSYEMDVAHVFELENGKFALVTEEGCSCYESSDAQIELFPDKKKALKQFEKWKRLAPSEG